MLPLCATQVRHGYGAGPRENPLPRAHQQSKARGQAASTTAAVSEVSPGNEAPWGGLPEPPRAHTHFLQPVFPLFYSFFLFSGKPHAQYGVDLMTPRSEAPSLRSPAAWAVPVSVLTTQYSPWACVPRAPGGPKLCHVWQACWHGSKRQGTRWRRSDQRGQALLPPSPHPTVQTRLIPTPKNKESCSGALGGGGGGVVGVKVWRALGVLTRGKGRCPISSDRV